MPVSEGCLQMHAVNTKWRGGSEWREQLKRAEASTESPSIPETKPATIWKAPPMHCFWGIAGRRRDETSCQKCSLEEGMIKEPGLPSKPRSHSEFCSSLSVTEVLLKDISKCLWRQHLCPSLLQPCEAHPNIPGRAWRVSYSLQQEHNEINLRILHRF